MRKHLRMLCMGVMAAVSAVSFAQTNVTNKLRNADMEKGVIGWDITFEGSDLWKKVTKNQASQPGYYGVHDTCLEVWKSNQEPVANNSISQTLKNLPNGTYVFGAYMAATDQTTEATRELMEGVTIFANEASTPVATNSVQNRDTIWGHTSKFNVATTVVDGTLKVGVNVFETTASFVLIDNASLYYFGEMEPAAALDEMAKIDIAAMLAIADTCLANKMDAATLAMLNEGVEIAKALTTDAELFNAIENLGWGIRKAVSSIKDYDKVAQALKTAKAIAEQEWTEFVADALAELNVIIAEVEEMYNEGVIERAEINDIAKDLSEAAALVQLDNVYLNLDIYNDKLDDLTVGDGVGEYSEDMIIEIEDLLAEVGLVLAEVEEGSTTAVEALSSCNSLFKRIDSILANPNTSDEFPIVIPRSTEPLNNKTILKGAYLDATGLAHYKSKTFHFDYPLAKIRFIIKQNGNNSNNNGYPFVALSDFAMYDENGDPIELTEEMVTSNACYNTLNPGKQDGMGIYGMLDGDLTTYFHSAYANGPADYHYIEVTLPEDEYTAFSFTMAARSNSEFHTGQFPAELEIIHLSEAGVDLRNAVSTAKGFNPYQGIEPGYYNVDVAPYKEAVAAAEALIGAEVSDGVIYAAIDKIAEERAIIEEAGIVLPDPEKEYRVVSALPFVYFQGVQKALTVFNNGNYNNRLGWETACADSTCQLFKFEPIENAEGKMTYAMKHVATGLYVSHYEDAEGNVTTNAFGLSEEPEVTELVSLGEGQFGIKNGELAGNNSNMMHTNGYSNGQGVSSTLVKWNTEANSGSAWFLREMSSLPRAMKSISDLDFKSENVHLYEKVNTITLTADKECAFENFKLYDLYGNEIYATMTANGASATISLDIEIIMFSFAFTNTEGVSEVTVNGSISKISILQEAYNTTLAVAPVMGDEVGQFNDLSEYEAAIEAAKNLLTQGGTDEAIEQAVANLEAAVANLGNHINYPKADQTYFLIAGYQEFKNYNGVDMAIFAKTDYLSWSYVNIDEPTYRWRFVETEPTEDGKRIFYVQNVANGLFIGSAETTGVTLPMIEEVSDAQVYQIYCHTDGSVALTNGNGMYPHFNSHSQGKGVYGNMIYWNGAGGASAIRIVEVDTFVDEYLKELGVENIDVTDEQVAPAVQGIYDLFGRRIDTPAATGIYIVDGVKRVIKK